MELNAGQKLKLKDKLENFHLFVETRGKCQDT